MKKDNEHFLIGEVAKKVGIHDQTIRMYERKNLLKPLRTANNTRIFTKNDLTRINAIITLTQEVGLNLSGVKMVFSLARKLKMNDDELLDFVYDHINEF
ncbi:MAG: MerR family transcriptional regulator [Candidatus Cloacimonetes bacterium]|nr:MerR family transcriptional regulator [Candidatus Cloacimonadota bacterium]